MSLSFSRYIEVLQQHLNYHLPLSGRQYCQFCLFWVVIAITLSLLNPLALVAFSWVSFPFFFIKSLQRLKDMGINRWYIALGILPVIGLLFFIYTLFAPPKQERQEELKPVSNSE